MVRPLLGAACLIGLTLALATNTLAAENAVLLRYHFRPGEELRYRVTVHGDVATTTGLTTPSARAAAPQKVPTIVDGTYELVEKTTSVSPEGVATVSVVLEQMETVTSVMGARIFEVLGASGKLEMRTTDQPEAPSKPLDARAIPLYEMKLGPTGEISMVSTNSPGTLIPLFAGENLAVILNGCLPGLGMPVLPEKPVEAGDAWDSRQTVRIPLATPGMAGDESDCAASDSALTLKTALHSSLLWIENGDAVIETQATTAAPSATGPGGAARTFGPDIRSNASFCDRVQIIPLGSVGVIEKLDESMSSTERFDIKQGAIEGGSSEMSVSVVPALGQPLRASIDGTLMTRVEPLIAPPAPGAP